MLDAMRCHSRFFLVRHTIVLWWRFLYQINFKIQYDSWFMNEYPLKKTSAALTTKVFFGFEKVGILGRIFEAFKTRNLQSSICYAFKLLEIKHFIAFLNGSITVQRQNGISTWFYHTLNSHLEFFIQILGYIHLLCDGVFILKERLHVFLIGVNFSDIYR